MIPTVQLPAGLVADIRLGLSELGTPLVPRHLEAERLGPPSSASPILVFYPLDGICTNNNGVHASRPDRNWPRRGKRERPQDGRISQASRTRQVSDYP